MKDFTTELSEIFLSGDFPIILFLIFLIISIPCSIFRSFKIMIDYIKEH